MARLQPAVALIVLGVLIGALSLPAETSLGLDLSSYTVRQGEVVLVTLSAAEVGPRPVLRFLNRTWPLYRQGDYFRTYLGTDPTTPPGKHPVVADFKNTEGRAFHVRNGLTVLRVAFPTRRLTLDPEKAALLDPKLVAIERRKVSAALRMLSAEQLWEGMFAIPVEGRRTSPYGVISVYQGRRRGFHRGTDFAAPTGTSVYAANHGIVRLAEPLPVSGNAVFIDHGFGIVTSYLHMSAIHVRAGQHVRKGDLVGAVGSTGLSTGPHLHWALRTNGVLVDPLLWTGR